ncbi:MAG: FAD-dependent monooxygenase [Pelagibacteraceae bacterium]
MKKKIIIIGAGVAGLVLANILKKNSDYEFIIYEKNDSLILDQGYGIQLSVNSISILNQIGFEKINYNEINNPSYLDFYNINYKKITDLDLTVFNNEKNKYTTLKRSTLIKFLRNELFSNSIKFGKMITNLEQNSKKINIEFQDGTRDKADYLVVSDGVFSKTKSVIEKKEFKKNYYGALAIRSNLNSSNISQLNRKNISLLMGSDAHIVVYPVNKKEDMNLVCVVRQSLKNLSNPLSVLKKTLFRENKNLINLFKDNLTSWPIYTSIKPIKSIYENVFYIGDAFYTFPPTMAQGASQSIESANEIFKLLDQQEENIQDKYFTNRLKRTKKIIFRSKLNFIFFHLSNSFLRIIRNLIIKNITKKKFFKEIYLGNIFRK